MGRILFDFLWVFIVTSVVLGLLSTIFPFLGNTGTAIGTITGAMMAGQRHGRLTGSEASRPFSWKVALMIAIATVIVIAIVVAMVRQADGMPELDAIPFSTYALGVVVMGGLILLLVRFFFRWGTKMGANSLKGPTA